MDGTFNLGKFYVTLTTYEHLMLDNINTGKISNLSWPHTHSLGTINWSILPTLPKYAYYVPFFEECQGCQGCWFRWRCPIKAIKLAFSDSIRLQCFTHVQDELLRKLTHCAFQPQVKNKWFVTFSDGNNIAPTTKVCWNLREFQWILWEAGCFDTKVG